MNTTNKNCAVIQDLLPLYADSVCSEESRKAVHTHLSECKTCREMLEKMNQKVAIAADHDISSIRKIRSTIRIGKIVTFVIAFLLLAFGLYSGCILAVTDCEMDYEDYGLAYNVWVEEDHDGTLWLCTKGKAAALLTFAYPTVSDTSGNHMGYEGQKLDKENMVGKGYTFRQLRISKFAPFNYPHQEIRIKIEDTNSFDMKYIFYYVPETNTEYVLWGEKPD